MGTVWISRFSAVGVSREIGRVDLRFGPGATALGGDMAPALLQYLGAEVAGEVGEIRSGFTAVEMSGQAPRTLVIDQPLGGKERAALHAAWVEEFRRRRNRGSPRAARLRAAWQLLWGSKLERLWAAPGPPPFIASADDDPRLGDEPRCRMPPDLLTLASRGSGYQTAFDVLGQVAMQEPDLLLITQPNRSLHFLIARRMLWALELAAPRAQVIGATYDPRLACAQRFYCVGEPGGQGSGQAP